MTLRLITGPSVEPATVAEVKLDARIDGGELDETIGLLITSARQSAEEITGRALITQTWELVLDRFPFDDRIEIGKLPISSVTSVKYYDVDGVLQTLDSSLYAVDVDTLPGWIYPVEGESWPSVRDEENSVIIRFVAGYGDSASDVPAQIRYWIRAQAAAAIQSQSDQVDKSPTMQFVNDMLNPYRLHWV